MDQSEVITESKIKRPRMSAKEDNVQNHCKYFVTRKKRFCKMTVKLGEEYCGEHQTIFPMELNDQDKANKRIRVVCPLDNTHTCYAHNLEKHKKICNAKVKKEEPFISKGINSGIKPDDKEDVHKLLANYTIPHIQRVISKVNELYEKIIKQNLTEKISCHELVEDEISKPEHGEKSKKHLKQVSSILGLLKDYNMMKSKTCYIEFGAGRGQLSYWIAKGTDSYEQSTILLIEKSSPKHKKDNKLCEPSEKVCRIRADISDLVLDELDIISKSEGIVGVTKHLCGEATDLALRCLANSKENQDKIFGCVMTFCCHHRCRWTPYIGKDFFKEKELTSDDFYIICGMSSWATCGSGVSREKRKEGILQPKLNERDIALGLSREEKEEVGRRSKSVINWGRMRFLENISFRCHLHYYVNKNVSLENACIVAIK
ncbi:hypothetical protein JTB14_009774 [Gonioctena quinquepunctata]|nr:hypothetical protein JTB14_009774 [Gonioctena quinquepunctata]